MREERGNLRSSLDAAGNDLPRASACGCISSKAVIVHIKSSSKQLTILSECKDRLYIYMNIGRFLHCRRNRHLLRFTMTRYHPSKSARVQTLTSLEPDPKSVLRKLGQDSNPAARTATTYTWALEVGRAAPEVYGRRHISCAVQHGPGACTAAAAAAKKTRDKTLLLDPSVSHMGQHRRAAGRRAQGAANARASMCTLVLCALGLGLYSSTFRTRSKGTPVG